MCSSPTQAPVLNACSPVGVMFAVVVLLCFVREDLETLGVVCGGRELAGDSVPSGAFEGFG